ncbi:hypothetical protein AB1Y20_023271 [Prymnesium parvum]|uniref:Uncharacterized protein n=1 Tax=Prymnesium parvum TaxID=97485 RepID=A0AB34JFQ9_PRYPA
MRHGGRGLLLLERQQIVGNRHWLPRCSSPRASRARRLRHARHHLALRFLVAPTLGPLRGGRHGRGERERRHPLVLLPQPLVLRTYAGDGLGARRVVKVGQRNFVLWRRRRRRGLARSPC